MRFLRPLVVAVIVSVAGCGGGEDDPSFDRTKNVQDLTVAEYDSFCAWSAETLGGEGRTLTCPLVGDPRQVSLQVQPLTACLTSTRPACPVSAYTSCFEALKG